MVPNIQYVQVRMWVFLRCAQLRNIIFFADTLYLIVYEPIAEVILTLFNPHVFFRIFALIFLYYFVRKTGLFL